MRLYGFWRSLASYRVRVALRLKGLAFEEIPVDLLAGAQHAADFAQVNAAHAVPVLVDDGATLTQSLAIIEYLDEKYPDVPLLPRALAARARVRSLALLTIADAHPLITPRIRKALAADFGADAAAIDSWARHWLGLGLETYERELSTMPPAPFVGGAAPGLADICIMSHLVGAALFGCDTGPFEAVRRLAAACEELEAFRLSHPARQPGAPGQAAS